MKNYCDFCKKETQTSIDYEPTKIELANGETVHILGKFAYCLQCGEQVDVADFHIENLENAAHIVEMKEKY